MISQQINRLKQKGDKLPRYVRDELESIENELKMMGEYYLKGVEDPQMNDVYQKLSRKVGKLEHNMVMAQKYDQNHLVKKLSSDISNNLSFSIAEIRQHLEDFTIDMAMLSLDSEDDSATQKHEELQRNQHTYRVQYFAKIALSTLFSAKEREELQETILSPSIDTTDVHLLLTAVMLGCMIFYDAEKHTLLYNIYKNAAEEELQQKAVTAYLLCLPNPKTMQGMLPEDIASQQIEPRLLAAIQKQIIYTKDSEHIGKVMEKEIMPDIVKHSDITIINNKIQERKRDKLEEIINPNKDEQDIEKMEETMRRIQKMQEQGSDLFYAGFRHVKHHPFFNTIINWFIPFFLEHPFVSSLKMQQESAGIMKSLIEKTPFCESDKYSFVIAMEKVFQQLPPSMKELLSNGHAELGIMGGNVKFSGNVLARRKFMQDLFRFFSLNDLAKDIESPFSSERFLFINNYIALHPETNSHDENLANDENKLDEAAIGTIRLLRNLDDNASVQSVIRQWQPQTIKAQLFAAYCIMNDETEPDKLSQAMTFIERVLQKEPENNAALYALPKLCYKMGDAETFNRYSERIEKNLLTLLFKKNNDPSAGNMLARAYFMSRKYDEALKETTNLLNNDCADNDTLLLYALYLMRQDKIVKSVKILKRIAESAELKAKGADIPARLLQKLHNEPAPFGLALTLQQTDIIASALL